MDVPSLPPYRGLDDRTPDRGGRRWDGGSVEFGLFAVALLVAVGAALVAAGWLALGAYAAMPG